ncbi:MAG TPA: hypothetical protein VLC09_20130 [Polyangiaceae bacterium]|nr:hypothetical protein [Polyangiaceae bacterium]
MADMGPARRVDQTSFYVEGVSNGNCTEAAVATLLGLRLDEVPEFPRESPAVHWDAIDAFFAERGLELVSMAPDDTLFGGLHLASGLSARGVHHMVVMQNGAVVHDPHPSRAGLLEVKRVYIVVPRDPRVLAGGDAERDFPCCGGNDETPRDHCRDCSALLAEVVGAYSSDPDDFWRSLPPELASMLGKQVAE